MVRAIPSCFRHHRGQNGAVPLVQMDPDGISIAAIASGRYDGYLSSYAEAVRAYRHPVILSFGHEMNGSWYSWGYRNTPRRHSWPPGGTSSRCSARWEPGT